jgi:hypothetical protein
MYFKNINKAIKQKNLHSKSIKIIKSKFKRGSIELKKHLSLKLKGRNIGKNGSNWQGGITQLNRVIRDRFEYHSWVSAVMTRDNWTCQTCGKRGGKLHAHHKKGFALIIKENNIKTIEEAINCAELWDINNGITLCVECHKETENYLSNCLLKRYVNRGAINFYNKKEV